MEGGETFEGGELSKGGKSVSFPEVVEYGVQSSIQKGRGGGREKGGGKHSKQSSSFPPKIAETGLLHY